MSESSRTPESPTPNSHTNFDAELLISQLREELRRTQEEKDSLASQHQTLLSKVSNIRNTLGAKLKQDAVRNYKFNSLTNFIDLKCS